MGEAAMMVSGGIRDRPNGERDGIWIENIESSRQAIAIKIRRDLVTISCCYGTNLDARISFITTPANAREIVRAMAEALGMTVAE